MKRLLYATGNKYKIESMRERELKELILKLFQQMI